MSQTYRVTCPLDGLTLLPVVLDPRTAPWFCMACRHSWWVAELSETARAQFRPSVRDFGYGAPLAALQSLVRAELSEACARGTSCREDQIDLLPPRGLVRMRDDERIEPGFRVKVNAEFARKESI